MCSEKKIRIPLYKIFWDDDDVKAVLRVIQRGEYWTMGPEIKEFEERIAEYLGVEYAVVFNSGTSALHAAMLAFNIGHGDEVIVPSFTFIATANAALFVGAKPVFAEIEEERYDLDPDDVLNRITSRTRAIIPIHYGGMPAKIKELREIADDHNLVLIEDAAESLGAITEEGRKVGTYGDAAIFSFCGNKVITTGEGGVVVTNDKRIYEKLKLIRSHGRLEDSGDYFRSPKRFDYVMLGYNWRISSITAALGLSQLAKLERAIKLRRRIAEQYTKLISKELGGKVKPFTEPKGVRAVYQMYTIRLPWDNGMVRDKLQQFLLEKGIITKIYFEPVHLYTIYRTLGHREGELPRTEIISKQVLTLPIYPTMTIDEVEYVVNSIKQFLESYDTNI